MIIIKKIMMHLKPTIMKKLVIGSLLTFACIHPAQSQVTYLETKTDGQGGIEGIQRPQNMVTDSSGKELFIVANNCLTHLRKQGLASSYEFVESIKYSSAVYSGLWNADEIKSSYNCKYLYVTGDNEIMTFTLDATNGKLKYLESIKNTDDLTIGYATSSYMLVSPDNRNLYLATTHGAKTALQIFKIDPSTGLLTYKNSSAGGWSNWDFFNTLVGSPSNQYLYTISRGNTSSPILCVFKRNIGGDNLDLLQVIGYNDSIKAASRIAVSPDNKNVYVYDNKSINIYNIHSNGTLSYFDKLYIPSCFVGFTYANYLAFSNDSRYLYVGGDYDLSVFERSSITGKLIFSQVVHEGDPDYPGFNDVKSLCFSNQDSLLYAVSLYNDAIHVFGRNTLTGKIYLLKKLFDQQGKIFGLSSASDLLSTNDNKTIITLTPSGLNSMAIFDRLIDGSLSFRRNVTWSELGPAIGAPKSFKITPDDKYLYIASTNMYGIRLLKRDPATKDFTFSKSYTVSETGMTPEEYIMETAITSDMKNFYASTYTNIVTYSINQASGELAYQSLHKILDNSTNGLRGITSVTLSTDNKYLYTCSNSYFYPGGITVYSRSLTDGSLIFLQTVKIANVYKVLVSHDKKNVYALGDYLYCYAVDATNGNLQFINKLKVEDLGYSQVYKFDDGIITNDDKAIIGITQQGKAILSFYRTKETGDVTFKQIRYYSADLNYSSGGGPKLNMSYDSKNIYVIAPYDKTLTNYMSNVPLGLNKVTDVCEGDNALLSVDNGYDYLWSNGKTTAQIKIASPGIYSVYVKDSLGREGWDNTNVVIHQVPRVKLTLDTVVYNNVASMYIIATVKDGVWPYSYLWNDNSANSSKSVTEADVNAKKKYYVLVSDKYSCQSSDTIILGVSSHTDVMQLSDNIKFFISPNPVSDKMVVHFLQPLKNNSSIEIFNSNGALLFTSSVEKNNSSAEIDLSNYSPGIYFMKLLNDKRMVSAKIIKQ